MCQNREGQRSSRSDILVLIIAHSHLRITVQGPITPQKKRILKSLGTAPSPRPPRKSTYIAVCAGRQPMARYANRSCLSSHRRRFCSKHDSDAAASVRLTRRSLKSCRSMASLACISMHYDFDVASTPAAVTLDVVPLPL